MNIKVDFAKWYDSRRWTLHLLPSIVIDHIAIGKHKNITILASWLLWSIGAVIKNDDWGNE